jgi:molybdate transport system substrate-binding protein
MPFVETARQKGHIEEVAGPVAYHTPVIVTPKGNPQNIKTVQDLATRVHEVLGGDRSRALTIARTESGQAVSVARFAAATAAGAPL